jgi:hypothetical protein
MNTKKDSVFTLNNKTPVMDGKFKVVSLRDDDLWKSSLPDIQKKIITHIGESGLCITSDGDEYVLLYGTQLQHVEE